MQQAHVAVPRKRPVVRTTNRRASSSSTFSFSADSASLPQHAPARLGVFRGRRRLGRRRLLRPASGNASADGPHCRLLGRRRRGGLPHHSASTALAGLARAASTVAGTGYWSGRGSLGRGCGRWPPAFRRRRRTARARLRRRSGLSCASVARGLGSLNHAREDTRDGGGPAGPVGFQRRAGTGNV